MGSKVYLISTSVRNAMVIRPRPAPVSASPCFFVYHFFIERFQFFIVELVHLVQFQPEAVHQCIQHQISHGDGEYIPLPFYGQLRGPGISLGIDLVIGGIFVDVVDAFNDGAIEPLPDRFFQLH
jgi:hypothetical protein